LYSYRKVPVVTEDGGGAWMELVDGEVAHSRPSPHLPSES
jgi:hypothetical protein